MKKLGLILLLIPLAFVSMFLPVQQLSAHHLLPKHELNCSADFPCPAELQRRIDFWIQVFKGWPQTTAIFHDPNRPERVYSVVDTGDGCSSRVKSGIKKARKSIKTNLYNTALKLETGAELSLTDRHYLELFANPKPSTLRNASENIRCQSGVRDSYISGLKRFSRYSYMVDTVLAQHDLPADIRYLPFVESSYNPGAYSKAGAAGMWQIMPSTARVLGLELNATIDERLDPEAATRAAARYLVNARRSLTEISREIDPGVRDEEISPFVITSYNYGVSGMRKAIRTVKPDYLTVLETYKSPAFQIAVKNFYSSFLAARHVSLNAKQYFGDIEGASKVDYATLVLKYPISVERISKVFGVSEDALKPINLGLTRFVWNGWRMIPGGYQLKLPRVSHEYKKQIAKLDSLTPETVAPGSENYSVRKGDTACGIARALQVNCKELISMNQLGKRAMIRIGQKLEIPRRLVAVSKKSIFGQEKTVVKRESGTKNPIYKVRKGDTACAVAERYGVSCRQLIAVNKLGRKATIFVGQNLTLPGISVSKGQVANLDADNRYLVKRGDFACGIADRFNVSCNAFKQANKLNKKATIYPGQRLKIPGLEVPNTTETVNELAQVDKVIKEATEQTDEGSESAATSPGLSNLLDALPDLRITVSQSNGQPVYRIWVEADETIGHYADWLGMRSTKEIRAMNKMKQSQLRIGQSLQLPLRVLESIEVFERKRVEYHQVLSEELKSHYTLTGIRKYVVKSGDSTWSLARESGFPIWLFYRLNPSLKISALKPKDIVLLPELEAK